jgi:ketopantoate reductase
VRSGAEVTLLVKPKHADDARRGFVLQPLNEGRAPVTFADFRVVVAPEPGHDAVVLTMSSPALQAPGFVADLTAGIGDDATVVSLQPAIADAELVAAHVPEPRLVHGMIGFLAYAAPGGVAVWTPPLSSTLLSGQRARPLAQALRAGRLPCRVVRDAVTTRSLGGAVLEAVVTALEAAGWDRRALARDRSLRVLAAQAAREAVAIAARRLAVRRPLLVHALGPLTLRLGLAALARLAPFDISTFFRSHYAKISEQHRLMAADERAQARALGIPTPALEALAAAVTSRGQET